VMTKHGAGKHNHILSVIGHLTQCLNGHHNAIN